MELQEGIRRLEGGRGRYFKLRAVQSNGGQILGGSIYDLVVNC